MDRVQKEPRLVGTLETDGLYCWQREQAVSVHLRVSINEREGQALYTLSVTETSSVCFLCQ
jgi:hypothetical protein